MKKRNKEKGKEGNSEICPEAEIYLRLHGPFAPPMTENAKRRIRALTVIMDEYFPDGFDQYLDEHWTDIKHRVRYPIPYLELVFLNLKCT